MNKLDVDLSYMIEGGVTNYEKTIMRVTNLRALPARLKLMMSNISQVTEIITIEHTNPPMFLVKNDSGHMSYFNMDYMEYIHDIPYSDMYLSDTPDAGIRWHGGYLFIKQVMPKTKFGIKFDRTTWYIVAPIEYDTVQVV